MVAAIRTLVIRECGFVSFRAATWIDLGTHGDLPGQMPAASASNQTAIDRGQAGSGPRYQRREPERTVLHRVVREHMASLLAEAVERYPSGDLPKFIRGEWLLEGKTSDEKEFSSRRSARRTKTHLFQRPVEDPGQSALVDGAVTDELSERYAQPIGKLDAVGLRHEPCRFVLRRSRGGLPLHLAVGLERDQQAERGQAF